MIYVALRLARLSKTVLVIGCGKDVDMFILFFKGVHFFLIY